MKTYCSKCEKVLKFLVVAVKVEKITINHLKQNKYISI